MADEIELISDDDGLAVLGSPDAIQRFLDSVDLAPRSTDFRLDALGRVLNVGAEVARTGSTVAERSGRYVRLTEESARRVRELGLMKTKTPGISHAMLGEPGSISGWLQIEDGRSSTMSGSMFWSGASGLMAQLATQVEATELKALLDKMGDKLDAARRTQLNSELAKMDRAALAIAEAMTIREHGGNGETVWSKVQAESGTLDQVQGFALRELDALADRAEEKKKVGQLASAAKEVQRDVTLWLAVLARCFQLKNEFAALEIDHVREVAPQDLDGHCRGLAASQRGRRELIVGKTQMLIERLQRAGAFADENMLLHVRSARSVIDSVNSTVSVVGSFLEPLGIESARGSINATSYWDALRNPTQLKTAGAEVGQKTITGLKVAVPMVLMAVVTKVVKDSPFDGSDGTG